MLIFGVTGQPSSGKDTVASHLASLGFLHISSSDLIREEMRSLGLSTERSAISAFVTERRKERGGGYLAELAVKKITQDTVISGLRNTLEVEVLRNAYGKSFMLLAIEAPIETRYKWAQERKRIGDGISFEQFKQEEEKERFGNKNSHQVDAVIAMADTTILNTGTKEELLKKIDGILI